MQAFARATNCRDVCRDDRMGNYMDVLLIDCMGVWLIDCIDLINTVKYTRSNKLAIVARAGLLIAK